MSKQTRRILFYIVILVFFGASYLAVLTAQGYKYSFTDKRFLRTGAVTIHTNADAKVFFNDELYGSTSFFGNSFSINRLLPGQYQIRLQRDDNYSSWQKQVTVREGFVTDFPRIMILPQDEESLLKLNEEFITVFENAVIATPSLPTPRPRATVAPSVSPSPSPVVEPFRLESNGTLIASLNNKEEILDTNVLAFSFTDNQAKLLWYTRNELWVLWLADTDYQPFKKQGDKELITRFSSPITRAVWFRDRDHILVESDGFKIVEIDTRGGTNIIKI